MRERLRSSSFSSSLPRRSQRNKNKRQQEENLKTSSFLLRSERGRGVRAREMSAKGGGRVGASNNVKGRTGISSIPAGSRKLVETVKEIVNYTDAEIYAMLKECNMDPNEAVNRLRAQDPFHEVKSKRDKKKENKDSMDPRSRGDTDTSNRSGRGGADHYGGCGGSSHFGSNELSFSHSKPSHKKENGTHASGCLSSYASGTAGNNKNWQHPSHRDMFDKHGSLPYVSESDSSDDDILFTDDLDLELGDMLMINYFVANERSIMDRVPSGTSMLTGRMFVLEVLHGNPTMCHDIFRMHKHVFMNLCDVLKEKGLLKDGKKVNVEEGVAMFLIIIGHTTRYRMIGDRFQYSNHTISKWFKRVVRAVCTLGAEIIKPTYKDVVHERLLRKYPYFKDCIGAIDDTHIAVCAPVSKQTSFPGRKTNLTQNMMVACDFDMKFTFVFSGWEDNANDSRAFIDVVTGVGNNFPMPRGDQFYLVDAGYPNVPGFLAPYQAHRYRLRDYCGLGRPRGKEELFNFRHSSCRNIIERCIRVLKARFPILKLMPNNILYRQSEIPTACCTVHNFIREEHALDALFVQYSTERMVFEDVTKSSQNEEVIQFDTCQTAQMVQIRDQIATKMWNDYSATHP